MREIFTDLYNKVVGFFQTQEKENVKEVACNRLKLVLMQDRTNLTPFLLEKMRGEMITLLSKYVEMDEEELELNFEQEGESMALMLSIPVLRAKEEDEIKAILEEEEKALIQEVEAEEDSEDESSEEDLLEDSHNIEDSGEEIQEESDNVCLCGCQEGGECSCVDCSSLGEEVEEAESEEIADEEKQKTSRSKKKKNWFSN